MSKRNFFLLFVVAALFLVATVIPTKSNPGEVGLIAGRNVNMVSGTEWPGGDPWLQRQNEPSIAVSTRNPLHLLAGSNDYRSIDAYFEDELPGYEKLSSARDAWLGVYTSYDGGESWTSTLLPGYYHADTTPDGAPTSPLLGYEAAADPVVRAGTNGLFYYSGITFNRGQRGLGQVFVARFIDNNNKETGAIEYLDTKIVDVGNSGHFIDKPWIAVDIPREGSPTTTLPNGQTVPCGNVYMVYTSFMGDIEEDAHSKIMFSMSTDCGATWSNPTQITDAGQPYQAAMLAINPIDGRPFLAWRRFAKDHPDAIMLCWAEKKGKETVEGYWHGNIKFSKPIVLAEIDPFDQPTSEITFRTNDYPTMTIDKDGVIYVAWSQRGLGQKGEGKILMMTSADDGLTWQGPALVDDPSHSGYQFMPSLTSGPGGKVMMLWYDQRDDYCKDGFADQYIQESYPNRHTIDVRAAEVYPTADPYFSLETIQVSRYPWVFTSDYQTEEPIAAQLQYNMPNLRIFGGGKVPFLGDYIDITPSPMFVPEGDGWAYNQDPNSRPIYHAVWTDNRDVQPPGPGGNWQDYVAPGEGCTPQYENQTGIRNQNIYTSRITEGIIAGSPGNTKPLNRDRAFVVFVKNTTGALRDLILDIVETSGATAYFMKAGEDVGTQLEFKDVPPHSSVSATVMVESYSNEYATVRIDVYEGTDLLTYILLNPDSTNPFIEDPEGLEPGTPHVGSEGETHTPHVGSEDVINWEYSVDTPHVGSDGATSPHVGSNDDWVTPHVGSDDSIVTGSTIHVGTNNHVILSNIVNPHVGSDDFPVSIPENSIMTDIVWTVENRGNTTSTFSLNTFPFYDYDPSKIAVQLIVYKVYTTPTALGCELKEQEHHELIVSQTSPHVGSDDFPSMSEPWSFSDVTFSIPPKGTGEGEVEYKVILRYMDKNTEDGIELNPEDQGIIVRPEAPDIIDSAVIPPSSALVIKTRTIDLDNGIAGTTYSETLEVMGGYENYAWSLGGTASDWLSIDSTSNGLCYISGTPPTAGTYTLNVTVDDTDLDYGRPPLTVTKNLSITVYDPLNITTTSLPDGIVGSSYDQTLTAAGGNGDYTWSLASGTLPDGLSLSNAGVINGGAPASADTFNFTVEVTDSSNPPQTAQQPLSIYAFPIHTVSMPDTPNGPSSGISGTSYTYSTGGSQCSWGHNLEYRFDWDDGNQSSWSSSTSASHSWDTASTYNVTAQARCADDPSIVSGWSSALTVTINEPIHEIAYIYSTDTTAANSFKDFLEGLGYPTTLIHMDSIVAGMFAGKLILIGSDTGDLGTWGDSDKVDAINNSGQPIIGLGEGGYAFFGKLSLAIGYPHGWHGGDTDIIVVDSSHDVFNTPNNLGVSTGQTISIYSTTGHVGINLPTPPENVVLLGREVTDPDHYPLVQEDERYLLWGWTASPDSMTQMGKDLFENVVRWLAAITAAPPTVLAYVWSQSFSSTSQDQGWSVAVDGAGNVLVTGNFTGTVDFGGGPLTAVGTQSFLVKFDAAGNHLWSQTFGRGSGLSVAVDGAGNVLVTGNFTGTVDFGGGPLVSAGGSDIFVAKFDSNGVHLWSQRFGAPGGNGDFGFGVAVDPSGNVVVTGLFENTVDFGGGPLVSAGGSDIFLAKFDAAGNHLWSQRFGGTESLYFPTDKPFDVAIDGAGNVLVTGFFVGPVDFGGGPITSFGRDIFLAKFDAAGNHLWSQGFGDATGGGRGDGVAIDGAGNVFVTGAFEGQMDFGGGPLTAVSSDFFLAKYDEDGNHLWSQNFSSTDLDQGFDVAIDGAGNVLVTGQFCGTMDFGGGPLVSAGESSIFLAKYDAAGNYLWSQHFGDAAGVVRSVAIDGAGNVLVTGDFWGTVDFGGGPLVAADSYTDIFLAKFETITPE